MRKIRIGNRTLTIEHEPPPPCTVCGGRTLGCALRWSPRTQTAGTYWTCLQPSHIRIGYLRAKGVSV